MARQRSSRGSQTGSPASRERPSVTAASAAAAGGPAFDEDLLRVQRHLEEELHFFDGEFFRPQEGMNPLDWCNVVGIGIGENITSATGPTGEQVVTVYVRRKTDRGNIPERARVDPDYALGGRRVLTDIVEMALPVASPIGTSGAASQSQFIRPSPCGVSISNSDHDRRKRIHTAGTLGCLVTAGENPSRQCLLSNSHVIAGEGNVNLEANDIRIVQPGTLDLRVATQNEDRRTVGWLLWGGFTRIEMAPVGGLAPRNEVDAALAETIILPQDGGDPWVVPEVNGYTLDGGLDQTTFVGESVRKTGRTTATTDGMVTGMNISIKVSYTSGDAYFVKQIKIQGVGGPFVRPGDSGSLVVNRPGHRPVGLVFAAVEQQQVGFANPLWLVMEKLNIHRIIDQSDL